MAIGIILFVLASELSGFSFPLLFYRLHFPIDCFAIERLIDDSRLYNSFARVYFVDCLWAFEKQKLGFIEMVICINFPRVVVKPPCGAGSNSTAMNNSATITQA